MSGRRRKVGLFGLLGSGNIGNDASMESVLGYLRSQHPDAIIDAMCMGPDRLRSAYGIEAVQMSWARNYEQRVPRIAALGIKVLGKLVDAARIANWVRRHDVVIVPGMGVLETTLPLRALGGPYSLFLLSLSGRIFGTKVALVSVGANAIKQPMTRWFYAGAASLASYVSYRDALSAESMPAQSEQGNGSLVYPDLAFGIQPLTEEPGDPNVIGIGVMDFHGSNDDRHRADQIRRTYVEQMKSFVLSLVDSGRTVRLFVGDTTGHDDAVVEEIVTCVGTQRPGLPAGHVLAEPVSTFAELMTFMAPAGAILATRFHNLICGLLLGKPTIALCYAAKHRALMAETELAEFCQPADNLDASALIDQLAELQSRSAEVRLMIAKHNAERERLVGEQFTALSGLLLATSPDTGTAHEPGLVPTP
ncbi:MAG: polysaccharide pyruvyl transferase family protein [Streptosporangiaceae bacterium]